MLIYSNWSGRNAIIEIIARGDAECDNWNNYIFPNLIPVLSNDKMRLWNLLHELFLLYTAIMKIIAFPEIFLTSWIKDDNW